MNSRKAISIGRYEATLEKAKIIKPLKLGPHSYHLEPEPLSPEFEEKAKNELRETPEVVDQALIEIRELLKGDPDLRVPNDDYFFAKFLRPCKWHAKSAFKLMQRYYRFRLTHPRYCDDLVPENERNILTSGVQMPLPIRGKDGCRLIVLHGGKVWKPKEVSLDETLKGLILLLDAASVEPTTEVCGVHLIIDMDGLSLSQVTYFTPSFAGATVDWMQRCLPLRLKGVHIVNQPFIFNIVFAFFKPFIQEKLRKRLIFHGTDRESLKSFIGSEALPKKYGGDMEFPIELIREPLWDYFCQFNEEFEEAKSFGYTKK